MFTVKCIANFVNLLLYSSFPAKLHSKDKTIVRIADEHLLSPLPPYRLAFAGESSGKLKWRLKWRFRNGDSDMELKNISDAAYTHQLNSSWSVKNSIKFVMTV